MGTVKKEKVAWWVISSIIIIIVISGVATKSGLEIGNVYLESAVTLTETMSMIGGGEWSIIMSIVWIYVYIIMNRILTAGSVKVIGISSK